MSNSLDAVAGLLFWMLKWTF